MKGQKSQNKTFKKKHKKNNNNNNNKMKKKKKRVKKLCKQDTIFMFILIFLYFISLSLSFFSELCLISISFYILFFIYSIKIHEKKEIKK